MTLALAIVLAQLDAGSRWERPLYERCPSAEPSVALDGGWRLVSPQRDARLACLMTTADERVMQLEAAPPPLGWVSLAFSGIALALGLFLGGYAGWTLAKWIF